MKLFWAILGIAVIAIVLWVFTLPVAGERCVTEGASKFYATGKVAVCQGGIWVIKRGVKF